MSSSTGQSVSDEKLAHKVQTGDSSSYGLLVERYEAKLGRYVRKFMWVKEDAEDVLQDVFLKAYENIQGFDTKRKFSSWIYRIAHNECINRMKKKKTDSFSAIDFDTWLPRFTSQTTPEDISESKELKRMIDKGVGKLSPKYREPIVLYYNEQMSYQEISDIMRIPVSTVGVRISRARAQLEQIFKKTN